MILTDFWRGVMLASCFWMIMLNIIPWYWRGKIRSLAVLVKRAVKSSDFSESEMKEAFHQVWITDEDGDHEGEWEYHWLYAKRMNREGFCLRPRALMGGSHPLTTRNSH